VSFAGASPAFIARGVLSGRSAVVPGITFECGSLDKPGMLTEQFGEQVGGWMWVSLVLTEAFSEGDAHFHAPRDAPAAAGFKVFVHPVLATEPFALAGVAGQSIQFGRCVLGNIDDEIHGLPSPEVIGAFHGIHEIEPGNAACRWSRVPLSGAVVGDAGIETGVPDQGTCDFMVMHVVNRGCSENEIRTGAADEFRDSAAAVVVKHNGQVAEFKAGVISLKNLCSSSRFSAANAGDLF